MSRDDGNVLDVIQAANRILQFVAGQDLSGFVADVKTHSAVLHQLIVMGEAAKRVSNEYRELHPEIPWRQIAGLRDVLVHHYDQIDLQEIWSTVGRDLPAAVEALTRLIPKRDP